MLEEKLQSNAINEVAYTGQNKSHLGVSGYCVPLRINKPWGYELIYQNQELY